MRPDVAILDARLPDGSGIDVCREIRSAMPEVRCVMLTSYDDDDAIFAAVMAGAAGYLLKEIRGSVFVDAIRQVAAGESLLDPSVTGRLLDRVCATANPRTSGSPLSPSANARSSALIADGLTNRQIARAAVPRREDREELRLRAACRSSACSDAPRPRSTGPKYATPERTRRAFRAHGAHAGAVNHRPDPRARIAARRRFFAKSDPPHDHVGSRSSGRAAARATRRSTQRAASRPTV